VRNGLADSAKQLRQWEPELCKRYPQVLLEAFANPQRAKKTKDASPAELQFDELELMDEVQVHASVTLARTQQITLLAAEASLAELNTLICSTLGLGTVQPERNPLRPEIYVRALKEVFEETSVPSATQLDWLSAMSVTLGEELRELYANLSAKLRDQGVASAGYAIVQTPLGIGIGRGIAQDMPQAAPAAGTGAAAPLRSSSTRPVVGRTAHTARQTRPDSSLLTLDKLRRLLSGELEIAVERSPLDAFAQHFEREFEGGSPSTETSPSDFAATVPAALEALQEMQQVDDMVQRLERRRVSAPGAVAGNETSVDAAREALRGQTKNTAQTLSLEVVTLMVDNIAMDVRLLEPVQQLIRDLEPAMLRLALVDTRFFTDKRHPARMLLQEITHRSMAYASTGATGFAEFLQGLQEAVVPLQHATIESAEPFELALARLMNGWARAARASERQRDNAVLALRQAEERNLLAGKIVREIESHPDASRVPDVVMGFLCGPWSQVVAQAQLSGGPDNATAARYKALVTDLLWSTHPALTRNDYAKLTRLVPQLLATLREGLETIHYSSTRASEFLEALLGLHQLAFRAANRAPDAALEPAPTSSARAPAMEDDDPWVAPQEASASNLMEFPDVEPERNEVAALATKTTAPGQGTGAGATESRMQGVDDGMALPLGSWFELLVDDAWARTQLTWASPHGTLFLFTSASGTPQSMTRRSRDKLVAAGKLRVISGQPVVDGALNAVAQQAMRNSVDTIL
jgi:hypothetical protein